MKNFHSTVVNSFNKASGYYNDSSNLQFQIADNLSKMVKIGKHDSVLDLGSGTGYIAQLINNHNIIQLDAAFNMCKIARSITPYVVNAKMESLPFLNNSMDIVTASLSLHWSHDITKTIKEMYRVIKKKENYLYRYR
ncbi:MAG: methyltransferase domain-containing protein [Rickettsiaceae bacterium H1]|nr:methyltransferase domain-containing protein [Rickettsiaceae bacterium H1]